MGDKRKRTALANWISAFLGGKSRLLASAVCCVLASCTTPHDPAREGIWIVKPTPMVRCQQTPEGVVCGSVRALRAEDVGI